MNKFLLFEPVLKKISDGNFFKTVFSYLLQIFAFFTLIFILWASWKLWSNMDGNLPAEYFIGALVVEAFLLAYGFVVINIFWIRSIEINNLPTAKDYPVTPIVVISLKMGGEILGALYVTLGFAIGLSSMIVNMEGLIPVSVPGIQSGGMAMIFGLIFGFMILAVSNFIAESIGVFVDIAKNTKKR